MIEITERFDVGTPGRIPWLGVVSTGILVVLTGIGAAAGLWKVLVVGWVAFVAMAGAAALARFTNTTTNATRGVWSYGLASGAMVMSAAIFLLPQAIGYDPKIGGLGVAAGLLAGYAGHTIGHRFSHFDLPLETTTSQLTAHALTGGVVLGAVYSLLPDLGLVLGLSIVSHKAPAGYAAARRLHGKGRSVWMLLLPAAAVGIAAIFVGVVEPPTSMAFDAAVFGFAAGIFLHIAMDFLPECEAGSEIAALADEVDHALLDRLRIHAVASTVIGAGVVAVAWLAVA